MADEISRLSAELAMDPAGTSWIPLADALRRAGRIGNAERIVLRGLERHPYLPDGHDALARLRMEQANDASARDEWEMALRLDPRHLASLKGLAFLAHRRGDFSATERLLRTACVVAPGDVQIAAAHRKAVATLQTDLSRERTVASTGGDDDTRRLLSHVPRSRTGDTAPPSVVATRSSTSSSAPRDLFGDIEALGGMSALLVDGDGLVLAGRARDGAGADASDVLGAELSGLGDEASRALSQLGLGAWDRVVVECEGATLAFAPARDGAIVLLATPSSTPLGLARVLLERTRRRADGWLEAL